MRQGMLKIRKEQTDADAPPLLGTGVGLGVGEAPSSVKGVFGSTTSGAAAASAGFSKMIGKVMAGGGGDGGGAGSRARMLGNADRALVSALRMASPAASARDSTCSSNRLLC